jgi:hypothetical protein
VTGNQPNVLLNPHAAMDTGQRMRPGYRRILSAGFLALRRCAPDRRGRAPVGATPGPSAFTGARRSRGAPHSDARQSGRDCLGRRGDAPAVTPKACLRHDGQAGADRFVTGQIRRDCGEDGAFPESATPSKDRSGPSWPLQWQGFAATLKPSTRHGATATLASVCSTNGAARTFAAHSARKVPSQ